MIRLFDMVLSLTLLVLMLPVLLVIAILVKLNSPGPVFYRQVRVGKDGLDFMLLKFRTMYTNADKHGLLTVGGRDSRVTTIGYYLRKFKMDELPQIVNVIRGEMSFVGPRPEVRRYVNLYSPEQMFVLKVLPGITDYASITYRNENDLLAASLNPEQFYINEIMPRKIELNSYFINNRSTKEYFYIIFKTVVTSLRGY